MLMILRLETYLVVGEEELEEDEGHRECAHCRDLLPLLDLA